MKRHNSGSSVFLEGVHSVSTLKASAFFWGSICVYESFIQELRETSNIYDASRLLLEKGVLKIVVEDVEKFRHGLSDKIYAGFDGDFLDFLHHAANKITVISKLPSIADELIKEASAIEYKDRNLQALIDSAVYKQIEDEHLEALYQNERLAPLLILNTILFMGVFLQKKDITLNGETRACLKSYLLVQFYSLPYINYHITTINSAILDTVTLHGISKLLMLLCHLLKERR
jgi:hypothetical protein